MVRASDVRWNSQIPGDGRLAELACTGASYARLQENSAGDRGVPRYSPSRRARPDFHKLTFDLVGKCSCESFESAVRICSDEEAVQCTGGSRQQRCRYLRVR